MHIQEAVGDTLEELWISYNLIEKMKGIGVLKKLKVGIVLLRAVLTIDLFRTHAYQNYSIFT